MKKLTFLILLLVSFNVFGWVQCEKPDGSMSFQQGPCFKDPNKGQDLFDNDMVGKIDSVVIRQRLIDQYRDSIDSETIPGQDIEKVRKDSLARTKAMMEARVKKMQDRRDYMLRKEGEQRYREWFRNLPEDKKSRVQVRY